MSDSKATKIFEEAQEKLNKKDGFFSKILGTSSKTERMEEAAKLFTSAGNAYRLDKNGEASGNAYIQAGTLFQQLNRNFEAAENFVIASSVYRNTGGKLQESVGLLQQAVDLLKDIGRLTIAARHLETMADIYEKDLVDPQSGLKYYDKAAELYLHENQKATARKCLVRVATIAADHGDYVRATSIFENFALESANDSLLKYNASDYAFKACLCVLCAGDVTNSRISFERLASHVPTFVDTRDYQLICAILESIEQEDEEQYVVALSEYDKVKRMDAWTTRLLSKVKSMAFEVDLR